MAHRFLPAKLRINAIINRKRIQAVPEQIEAASKREMMNVSFSVNEILHFPKNLCNITHKKGFKKRQKSNGRDKSEKE